MKSILYLNKGGRSARIDSHGPTEFMYGLMELSSKDWMIDFLDEAALGMERKLTSRAYSFLNNGIHRLCGIPLRSLFSLFKSENRVKLNSYDIIFVTTNTLGVSLAVLKLIGLVKPKVLFLAMGLIEVDTPSRIIFIYRKVLAKVVLCGVSKSDQLMLSQRLLRNIEAINFGVDVNFWRPSFDSTSGDYILSIGNDRHRDYETLVSAWKPSYPKLIIISKLSINSESKNIEIRLGDWHDQAIDDSEIRRLICKSKFVILPIKNTVQPSGQSVCLQSMACGKAVVLTKFSGLWNPDLLIDGKTCVYSGGPGDKVGLHDAVELLLERPDLAVEIGGNARLMVEKYLNARNMSSDLSRILNGLT